MRSLWAGVTGLQAHQIAMDVEGNNIANVNTTGFKYSRANFADLLSQTAKIATAPQGELGGKNSMQIGLGTQISSVTKIFKQGSVQTTDKNTDLAIQGDGFFVVSPDGGKTYKFTRSGDFTRDALGNFTDSNGYIVQGWMRDEVTGAIDATTPIGNITIPPGLTTPARDTTYIAVKANLNSGSTIVNKSPIYSLDQYHGWVDEDGNGIQSTLELHNENGLSSSDAKFNTDKKMYERGEDFGALFNTKGESFSLTAGQGAWVSYADASYAQTGISSAPINIDLIINGVQIVGSNTPSGTTVAERQEENMRFIQNLINQFSTQTGVEANLGGGGITLTNSNTLGTEDNMKNINLIASAADTTGFTSVQVITAFKYTYTPSSTSTAIDRTESRTFRTTEDLRHAMQTDARLNTDYTGNGTPDKNDGVTVTISSSGQFVVANPQGDAFNADDGDVVTATDAAGNPWTAASANLTIDGSFVTATGAEDVYGESLVNVTLSGDYTVPAGVSYSINGAASIVSTGANIITAGTYDSISFGGAVAAVNLPAASTYVLEGTGEGALANNVSFPPEMNFTEPFTLSADILVPVGTIVDGNPAVTVPTVIPAGTLVTTMTLPSEAGVTLPAGTTFANPANQVVPAGTDVKTADDFNVNLAVTGYSSNANKISENTRFATMMQTLQGALPTGNNTRTSQNIYAATHASSIDVFDSLGSKHTVRMEFRKVGVTKEGGTQWNMIISVPEPGVIDDANYPSNILTGSITFGSDGSLSTYSPSSIRYTANNGSSPNQNISLNFGTPSQFDGITSFDRTSNTGGVSQDGFPGGDLGDIRIDETGTLIGSFTNGRSFGLAQVSMAKFTNNEGLESNGGNTFIQTSNSGDPIIGQAAVGGRGFIQASSLEMSNVDLSRSLTQLIIIQRGYQANSKTITTSDQMLNTLLQLKQ